MKIVVFSQVTLKCAHVSFIFVSPMLKNVRRRRLRCDPFEMGNKVFINHVRKCTSSHRMILRQVVHIFARHVNRTLCSWLAWLQMNLTYSHCIWRWWGTHLYRLWCLWLIFCSVDSDSVVGSCKQGVIRVISMWFMTLAYGAFSIYGSM